MAETHPTGDALLDLALDRATETERGSLLEHLAGCPRCRHEYDLLSATVEQTLAAAPHVEPSAGFDRRALTAMGIGQPGRTGRVRTPPRSRIGQLAAAAVAGLVLGAGGTVALTTWNGPDAPVTTGERVALTTGRGEEVGTVARSVAHGQPVLVITVTDGPPGMHYECLLRLADGRRLPAGEWTLQSSTATWVVDVPAVEVSELLLVTDSGDVWSSTRL